MGSIEYERARKKYIDELNIQYRYQNLVRRSPYSLAQAEADLSKKGILPPKEEDFEVEAKETKSSFHPSSFSQYIGQTKAKKILQRYLSAIKERKTVFPHTLIYGKAGTGKTTLANIIAKELKQDIVVLDSASNLSQEELLSIVRKLNGKILYIDEIHSLPRALAETLYQAMEYFTINGKPIKPFTLIGATTELGELIKDRKPFYDRFKIILELEDYTLTDLQKIAKQFVCQSFPKERIRNEVFTLIAFNSRCTPRTAIRLSEATVYFKGNCSHVLDSFNILFNGYTTKDRKLLKYLALNPVGMGIDALCSYLGTSKINFSYEIEPYLIQTEVVIRTPKGRKITVKGLNLLKKLENV